jgi:hypothetical protein
MKTLAGERETAEILRRLRTVRPDSPRKWGRMNAHQMICHLTDAFRAVTGQKAASDVAHLLNRTVVKWIALYAPFDWPAGIATRPEVDQEVGGTKPSEFAADVAELEAFIALITARPRTVAWHPHPIFGQLSDAAMLRWAYLHMDHHLRQFDAQS